ncbi:L-carnitine dehydratase/bile acid-inducible protein F [Dentipellis sp. KUC8613]|nr:L-carnitine dehydratase/bile acid-inducible protein F [Dentipellis sp. KUC8613]
MLARTAKQHASELSGKVLGRQARARRLTTTADTPANLPLSGVRVLELGQLIAGPFAGQLLGHFGAEVIKVEPPNTGDPLRVWRELDIDGTSPWFRSLGRNKKSVTIDLRKDEGRALVKKLALESDVILENFKPGTLEKWGLGPADLQPLNPSLIFTRVSGYGQTGPWAKRPGYASVCEAESGFRYINGFPDPATGGLAGPPVRPNLSLGDSVAGLHAAFGAVLALLARRVKQDNGLAGGSTVDVSILESLLNLMEGIIPEYDRKGKVRSPSGSSLTGIVPTNAYPCLPSPATPTTPTYIIIGANADSMYERLMQTIGRPDLIGADYKQNPERVARQAEIEQAIGAWTSARSAEDVLETLNEIGVPVGRVVSVREIVEGEQVKARGLVEDVWVPARASAKKEETAAEGVETEADGWMVKMPKVAPLLEGYDARTRWAGPDLGQHNGEVFMGKLGLSEDEMNDLVERGIIGGR